MSSVGLLASRSEVEARTSAIGARCAPRVVAKAMMLNGMHAALQRCSGGGYPGTAAFSLIVNTAPGVPSTRSPANKSAAVALRNTAADPQAEAGAIRATLDEWLEQLRQKLDAQAPAGVGDVDGHAIVAFVSRGHFEAAAFGHGATRVHQQIDGKRLAVPC